MWTFTKFLLVYTFGGLTFLPLLVVLAFLHGYLTFPRRTPGDEDDSKQALELSTDERAISKGISGLEKFVRPNKHERDVAAGYFAVCREYVPGGINGKPPERTTPVGPVVAPESPSVYQSMYRSIFDRKQSPSIDPGNGAKKGTKKAKNVFFVVLRHGHLMLYDDSEQLEVRHVISLAHHDVSIYGGGEPIPDGELWIKRNAICLTRKKGVGEIVADGSTSKPFYLFSENCSDKEDFYFALLQNQDRTGDSKEEPPKPLQFEVKDIISLVQRLHSSGEHLQTRWINGLVGRLFLAIYKTPETERLVRMKITKKISRVKKPNFLSDVVLQKIDMGEGAPYITNPRMRDLTVDGECSVEMDLNYTGNFRLEVAAIARIDLGARFKAREVNLVLAVVLKKLEGHFIIRFKPPPSNRIWISFETMPKIEFNIEPIVSSRQITYGIILKAIESRIREVIAETVVLPHWDDIAFTDTMGEHFRGGIWASSKPKEEAGDQKHGSDDKAVSEKLGAKESESDSDRNSGLGSKEKSMSMPALATLSSLHSRRSSIHSSSSVKEGGISTAMDAGEHKPRSMRSGSFTTAASPVVSTETVNVDAVRERKESERSDAANSMIAISTRSQPSTPVESPVGSPSRTSAIASENTGSYSSTSSKEDILDTELNTVASKTPSAHSLSDQSTATLGSHKTLSGFGSDSSKTGSTHSLAQSLNLSDKRQTLASLGSATAAAKKWGWGVLSRHNDAKGGPDSLEDAKKEGSPAQPLGRGRPLPPPGTPLPPPEKNRNKSTPITVPKRKALPPPLLPHRRQDPESERRPVPLPPLPPRQARELQRPGGGDDGLLVVAAPPDSEPTTPLEDTRNEYVHSLELDDDVVDGSSASGTQNPSDFDGSLDLPDRVEDKRDHRLYLGAREGEEPAPTSWDAAQEEEARSKSIWADADNGHS